MQQRPSSSSSRALDDWIIDIPPEPQAKHPPRRRMDDMGDRLLGFFKRKILRPPPEKWIHAIPLILLTCLFVLWWFSYPVKLVIKDGKLAAIHQIKMPVLLNDIDVAILAAAISPIASVSLNLTSNNETERPPPVNKSDCRTVSRICFFQLCVGTCFARDKSTPRTLLKSVL